MRKTAHYRRAVWFSENPRPLSQVLRDSLAGVAQNEAPVFRFGEDLDCVVARRHTATNPIFLQFVTYEEGAPAAVIEAAVLAAALAADIAAPPLGKEYVQSQLFCVVRGDDVIWTSHNTPLREGPINKLFHGLIGSRSDVDADTMFELQAKLDPAAFKKAFEQGIAEIDLGLGDFKPALEALLEKKAIPGMNALSAFIRKDLSPEEVEAAANVAGKLVLRPGKDWDKPHVKELLSELASSVLDSPEDEFVIVTKSGVRLTKQKMSVHKDYEVEGTKQVLSAANAQSKLAKVLADLDETGLLEAD